MTWMDTVFQSPTRKFLRETICLVLIATFAQLGEARFVLADEPYRPTIYLDPLASENDVRKDVDPALETSLQIATLLKLEAVQFGFDVFMSTDTDTYRSPPQRRAFADNHRALVYLAITSGPGEHDCIQIYSPVAREEVFSPDNKADESYRVVELTRKRLDQENKTLASILQKKFSGMGVCAATATRRAAVLNFSMIPTVMLNFQMVSSRDRKSKLSDADYLKKVASAIASGLHEFVPQIKTIKK